MHDYPSNLMGLTSIKISIAKRALIVLFHILKMWYSTVESHDDDSNWPSLISFIFIIYIILLKNKISVVIDYGKTDS